MINFKKKDTGMAWICHKLCVCVCIIQSLLQGLNPVLHISSFSLNPVLGSSWFKGTWLEAYFSTCGLWCPAYFLYVYFLIAFSWKSDTFGLLNSFREISKAVFVCSDGIDFLWIYLLSWIIWLVYWSILYFIIIFNLQYDSYSISFWIIIIHTMNVTTKWFLSSMLSTCEEATIMDYSSLFHHEANSFLGSGINAQ